MAYTQAVENIDYLPGKLSVRWPALRTFTHHFMNHPTQSDICGSVIGLRPPLIPLLAFFLNPKIPKLHRIGGQQDHLICLIKFLCLGAQLPKYVLLLVDGSK